MGRIHTLVVDVLPERVTAWSTPAGWRLCRSCAEAVFWLQHLEQLDALYIGEHTAEGNLTPLLTLLEAWSALGEPAAIGEVVVVCPDLRQLLAIAYRCQDLGYRVRGAPLGCPENSRHVQALRTILAARAAAGRR
jgi:hypothetical protein